MKTKIFIGILMCLLLHFNIQAQTWIKHTAKEAKFKVEFPKKAEVQKNTKVYMASVKYGGTGYKVVTLLNRDFGKDYNKLLDENIEGFITHSDRVEKKSKLLKVSGYPAKQVYIRSASNTCIFYRVIITPDKLYQILVTKKGTYENSANLKKFLTSLEILR